jgi:hypothetical protein
VLIRKAAIVSNQHLQAKYSDDSKISPDTGDMLSVLSAADLLSHSPSEKPASFQRPSLR